MASASDLKSNLTFLLDELRDLGDEVTTAIEAVAQLPGGGDVVPQELMFMTATTNHQVRKMRDRIKGMSIPVNALEFVRRER